MTTKYTELFVIFSDSVDTFIDEVKKKKLGMMATNDWSVKEVLCHIVFWHENYAVNYKALAENKTPPLPEGMSTINV